MGFVGWLLFIVGALALAYAGIMDTTTGGSEYGLSRVHNLGLLSNRIYFAILGGFGAASGLLLIAAEEIRAEVARSRGAAGGAHQGQPAKGDIEQSLHGSEMPVIGGSYLPCEGCGKGVAPAAMRRLKSRNLCFDCFSRAIQ